MNVPYRRFNHFYSRKIEPCVSGTIYFAKAIGGIATDLVKQVSNDNNASKLFKGRNDIRRTSHRNYRALERKPCDRNVGELSEVEMK